MGKIKAFFKKIGQFFVKICPTKRKIIQLYAALLMNANVKGFATGKIYRGNTKAICTPGLNCYSCPGAVTACPMGALQNALAASGTRLPFYIFGIIILFGLILGRTICGWICPIGLGQELLYKIKSPKVKKSKVTYILSFFKYVILGLAIAVPIIYEGIPFFCKYICPAGTLEGGVGLLLNIANSDFFAMLGSLFTWKFLLLILIIIGSIFIFRLFCRFLCPLGALYGFFCRLALVGIKLDKNACTDCGLCIETCKMDIRRVGDHECIQCGECIPVCPTQAISWKGGKVALHPSMAKTTETPIDIKNGVIVSSELPVPDKMEDSQLSTNAIELTEGVAEDGSAVQNDTAPQNGEADNGSSNKVTTATPSDGKTQKARTVVRVISFVLAILVLVGALVYYNFLAPTESTTVYAVGDKCQDFTLELYDSQASQDKFSVLECRGKVVVINYWETTCDPCVEELPYFESVYDDYKDDIFMVAVHGEHITENVQAFIDDNGWNEWDMMLAQDTAELDTFTMLGGKAAFPITVILDAEGVITHVRQGKMSEALLRQKIEEALE